MGTTHCTFFVEYVAPNLEHYWHVSNGLAVHHDEKKKQTARNCRLPAEHFFLDDWMMKWTAMTSLSHLDAVGICSTRNARTGTGQTHTYCTLYVEYAAPTVAPRALLARNQWLAVHHDEKRNRQHGPFVINCQPNASSWMMK